MTNFRKYQVLLIAQKSGLLAARALELPVCTRIQAVGGTIALQECKKVNMLESGRITKCGVPHIESLNNNSLTVGKDGWSIHPFLDCFWRGPYVTFNDDTYTWSQGDWKKVTAMILLSKLNLVNEFQEIAIKAYETQHVHRASYETGNIEQLNVLTELVGRIQETNTNSMSDLVMTVKEKDNFGNMNTWLDYLKYGAGILVGIIVSIIILWILCVPWRGMCKKCWKIKRSRKAQPSPESIPMIGLRRDIMNDHTDTY